MQTLLRQLAAPWNSEHGPGGVGLWGGDPTPVRELDLVPGQLHVLSALASAGAPPFPDRRPLPWHVSLPGGAHLESWPLQVPSRLYLLSVPVLG